MINACRTRKWAYATASYRLLPEASGLDILSDTLDVTRYIYENVAKRLILAGSSAGGYLALATAVLPEAPPVLSVLSIYGMLDLAHPRYVQPGQVLKAPVDNITEQLECIYRASETGEAIDGYAFPENLFVDKRFQWIAALHEAAKIPDILTRISGLAARIDTESVNTIPESHRSLFPATFGITARLPSVALIHGDRDDFVDFQQSARTAEKLQQRGVKVFLEKAEGQGHGFDVEGDIDIDADRANVPSFLPNLARVMRFLEEEVSGV